jgi:rSAM/selenodomain-associated transferase 1
LTANKHVIIVFLRVPQLGAVKSRLAATIGEDQALCIYEYMLDRTLQTIDAVSTADKALFYYPNIPYQQIEVQHASHHLQTGKDLGDKMNRAFTTVLQNHESAIIVGTDCPDLTTEIISEAFAKLSQNDLVLGPAADGGYYLMGLKRPAPFLFDNIDWGTDKVLEQTGVRAENAGLTLATVATLSDIDYEEDWRGYCSRHHDVPQQIRI